MKKLFSLLLVSFLLFSCQKEVIVQNDNQELVVPIFTNPDSDTGSKPQRGPHEIKIVVRFGSDEMEFPGEMKLSIGNTVSLQTYDLSDFEVNFIDDQTKEMVILLPITKEELKNSNGKFTVDFEFNSPVPYLLNYNYFNGVMTMGHPTAPITGQLMVTNVDHFTNTFFLKKSVNNLDSSSSM